MAEPADSETYSGPVTDEGWPLSVRLLARRTYAACRAPFLLCCGAAAARDAPFCACNAAAHRAAPAARRLRAGGRGGPGCLCARDEGHVPEQAHGGGAQDHVRAREMCTLASSRTHTLLARARALSRGLRLSHATHRPAPPFLRPARASRALETLTSSLEEIQAEVRTMKLSRHECVLALHCCFVVKVRFF